MGLKINSVLAFEFYNQKRKHITTNKILAEILESMTI